MVRFAAAVYLKHNQSFCRCYKDENNYPKKTSWFRYGIRLQKVSVNLKHAVRNRHCVCNSFESNVMLFEIYGGYFYIACPGSPTVCQFRYKGSKVSPLSTRKLAPCLYVSLLSYSLWLRQDRPLEEALEITAIDDDSLTE